jgi:hypothetical protein
MRFKLIIIMLTAIVLIGLASASDDLGCVKLGGDIRITQTCADASYITITSISYTGYNGNSTPIVSNIPMTNSVGNEYFYDFNITNQLGQYDVREMSDGCEGNTVNYFTVTPSGNCDLSQANSTIYLVSIIVMFIVTALFYVMSFQFSEKEGKDGVIKGKPALKFGFLGLSLIMALVMILYSQSAMGQFVGTFATILNGFSYFQYIVLAVFVIIFIFVLISLMIQAVEMMRVKKGLSTNV